MPAAAILGRVEPLVPLFARAPGLATLREDRGREPVTVLAELPPGLGREELAGLLERSLVVAGGAALPALLAQGLVPDVAVPDGPGSLPVRSAARLAVAGPAALVRDLPGPRPAPLLLLEPDLAWLAPILGHGANLLPDHASNLLLVGLALGEGPLLWVGPPPAGWRELLAAAGSCRPGREVLVERSFPPWWPGQGMAEAATCALAWHPLPRPEVEARLAGLLDSGPRPHPDLVPGLVARAALAIAPASRLVAADHDRWLELGNRLHRALAELGPPVDPAEEVRKYQVYWNRGRAAGHVSPGIEIYRLVRRYLLSLGCTSLLDVGCGGGEVLEAARADGMRVVGVDLADGISGGPRHGLRSSLVLGSASRLPLADRSVDAFFSSDVLEHLPPSAIPAALDELARVARLGGVLAISARADVSGLRWGALLHLSVFPLATWREELERRFAVELGREILADHNPIHLFLLRGRRA